MKKILLISDTHGYSRQEILKHAASCDEVWHAGDWGDMDIATLSEVNPNIRGVYGNIDNAGIRNTYPLELSFILEGLRVYIIHIGGYPGRYAKGVKERIREEKPDLYICGHSHICKVMRDKTLDLVHFNPGAIGMHGFHKKRTMMTFAIDNGKLIDINILEYERN